MLLIWNQYQKRSNWILMRSIDRKSVICMTNEYNILLIFNHFLMIIQNYFQRLFKNNLYQKDNLCDRITMLAIYMSILRREIQKFVIVWNNHKIRKQSNRLNSVSERSWLLYIHSSSEAKQCGFIPNAEFLRQLQETTADWDKKFFFVIITKFINWL